MSGKQVEKDDEEDEAEGEVVILGDADCSVMRARAALQAAVGIAAVPVARMETISSGCGLEAGRCKGRVTI